MFSQIQFGFTALLLLRGYFVIVYLMDLTILLHRFRRKLLRIHLMANTYIIFKEKNVYYPSFNVV